MVTKDILSNPATLDNFNYLRDAKDTIVFLKMEHRSLCRELEKNKKSTSVNETKIVDLEFRTYLVKSVLDQLTQGWHRVQSESNFQENRCIRKTR